MYTGCNWLVLSIWTTTTHLCVSCGTIPWWSYKATRAQIPHYLNPSTQETAHHHYLGFPNQPTPPHCYPTPLNLNYKTLFPNIPPCSPSLPLSPLHASPQIHPPSLFAYIDTLIFRSMKSNIRFKRFLIPVLLCPVPAHSSLLKRRTTLGAFALITEH